MERVGIVEGPGWHGVIVAETDRTRVPIRNAALRGPTFEECRQAFAAADSGSPPGTVSDHEIALLTDEFG